MINPKWDALFRARGWGEYPGEDLIRFICRQKPRKALEIGCGPGANLWLLARKGIEFDAIDASPAAVEQARARLDHETPGWAGRIEIGDFTRLPADFTGYDAVIDSQALSCVDFNAARAVIADIKTRINPGGAFWSRAFAPGTTGIAERITGDIPRLYGDWTSIEVGEISRDDGARLIREWIITAKQ